MPRTTHFVNAGRHPQYQTTCATCTHIGRAGNHSWCKHPENERADGLGPLVLDTGGCDLHRPVNTSNQSTVRTMNHIDDEDMTYELTGKCRTLDAYQRQAMATRGEQTDLLYASGKLTIEAAELQQHVLKARYHGKVAPSGAMLEELGDVLWYAAAVATDLGLTLSDVAESNLAKLAARHGSAYNPAHYAAAWNQHEEER